MEGISMGRISERGLMEQNYHSCSEKNAVYTFLDTKWCNIVSFSHRNVCFLALSFSCSLDMEGGLNPQNPFRGYATDVKKMEEHA